MLTLRAGREGILMARFIPRRWLERTRRRRFAVLSIPSTLRLGIEPALTLSLPHIAGECARNRRCRDIQMRLRSCLGTSFVLLRYGTALSVSLIGPPSIEGAQLISMRFRFKVASRSL